VQWLMLVCQTITKGAGDAAQTMGPTSKPSSGVASMITQGPMFALGAAMFAYRVMGTRVWDGGRWSHMMKFALLYVEIWRQWGKTMRSYLAPSL
jgi:hypothetical protein